MTLNANVSTGRSSLSVCGHEISGVDNWFVGLLLGNGVCLVICFLCHDQIIEYGVFLAATTFITMEN